MEWLEVLSEGDADHIGKVVSGVEDSVDGVVDGAVVIAEDVAVRKRVTTLDDV
jgi:hypothetical protein